MAGAIPANERPPFPAARATGRRRALVSSMLRRALADWFRSDLGWSLVIMATSVVALLLVGPIVTADTPTYVQFSLFRSALTSTILWLTRSVGGAWSFQLFVAASALLTAIAAGRLSASLALVYGLDLVGRRLLHLLVLLPALRFAAEIGSVAMAFPLCLFWLADALLLLREPGASRLFSRVCVWQVLAQLARPQMLVLAPFTIFGAVRAGFHRRTIRPLLLCACWLFVGAACERGYQVVVNRLPVSARSLGIQLLTTVAYGMRAEDLSCLAPGTSREFASLLYERLHAERLLRDLRPDGVPASHQFELVYTRICWGAVVPLYGSSELGMNVSESSALAPRQLPPEAWSRMDSLTTGVALQLLRCGHLRYLRNVLGTVYETQKFYLFIVLFQLGLGVTMLRGGAQGTTLLLVSLLWCANVVAVAGLEYPMSKYTYYFDVPVACVLFAVLLSWRARVVKKSTAPSDTE